MLCLIRPSTAGPLRFAVPHVALPHAPIFFVGKTRKARSRPDVGWDGARGCLRPNDGEAGVA